MPTKSLDDYRAMIRAYYDAHPYEGDVSQYYGANDLVSGGVSEAQMAATNQPQDDWNESTWQGWRGSMPANELAEYDRLAHEKYLSDRNKSRMAALAAFGGIAGAGMLGAGMLGSGAMGGGGIGALGGAEGLAAADIAGGLIPAFGTEAGYAAGHARCSRCRYDWQRTNGGNARSVAMERRIHRPDGQGAV